MLISLGVGVPLGLHHGERLEAATDRPARGEDRRADHQGAARAPGRKRRGPEQIAAHERARCHAHDQAATVRGHVDVALRQAEDDVVAEEDEEAVSLAHQELAREDALVEQDEREQGAVDAEDGAGRSHPDRQRMEHERRERASDAAHEVDEEKGEVAEDALGELSHLPERPQVEGDVKQARVEEHRADRAPPLAFGDRRSEVASHLEELSGGGAHEGHAARELEAEAQDDETGERRRDPDARRDAREVLGDRDPTLLHGLRDGGPRRGARMAHGARGGPATLSWVMAASIARARRRRTRLALSVALAPPSPGLSAEPWATAGAAQTMARFA